MSTYDDDTVSTATLLERCRQAQADADKASVELAAALRMHRLSRLADQLAAEYGACSCPRDRLIDFLAFQVAQCKRMGLAGSEATALIDQGYLELQQQRG